MAPAATIISVQYMRIYNVAPAARRTRPGAAAATGCSRRGLTNSCLSAWLLKSADARLIARMRMCLRHGSGRAGVCVFVLRGGGGRRGGSPHLNLGDDRKQAAAAAEADGVSKAGLLNMCSSVFN